MQNRKRQTFFVTVTNRKSRACYFASVTERRQNTFDKMGFSPHRADRSDKRPFPQKNAALNSSQIPLSALRRALRLSYFSPPVIIHHFFSDCNTIYSNSESFTIIVFETRNPSSVRRKPETVSLVRPLASRLFKKRRCSAFKSLKDTPSDVRRESIIRSRRKSSSSRISSVSGSTSPFLPVNASSDSGELISYFCRQIRMRRSRNKRYGTHCQ